MNDPIARQDTPKRLVVLGTGGTIAGCAAKASDVLGYVAGQVSVADLVQGLDVPMGYEVESEQLAQVDSKDMGPAIWRRLLARVHHHLRRTEVHAVVITHGTDTLEETAYLLQRVLNPTKPVVLTCAMRPATALSPDGPQNLSDALNVAALPDAQGVLVVCAGRVHGALDVQKVHHQRLDAFDSGDAGVLGSVENGRFVRWRDWPDSSHAYDERHLPALLALACWPRVEWVTSHAGADGWIVRALLQASQTHTDGALQGIVVAGTGNATLHRDLEAALKEAMQAGCRVYRTTRCASGNWTEQSLGNLEDLGVAGVPGLHLPPAKARLAVMLDLISLPKRPGHEQ